MDDKKKQERAVITQMVDAIVKDKKPETPEDMKRLEKQRKQLSGRALEYLMFMDDDE